MHRATRSLTTNHAVPVQVYGEIELDSPKRAGRRGPSTERSNGRVTRGASRLSAPAEQQSGVLTVRKGLSGLPANLLEEESEDDSPEPQPKAGPSKGLDAQPAQPLRAARRPAALRQSLLEPDSIRPLKLSERAEALRKQAGHCVSSLIERARDGGGQDDARLDSDLQSLESLRKGIWAEAGGPFTHLDNAAIPDDFFPLASSAFAVLPSAVYLANLSNLLRIVTQPQGAALDILGAVDDPARGAADLMLAAWKEFFSLAVPPNEAGDLPSTTLLLDLATQRYLSVARAERHRRKEWADLERCFSPSEVARLEFWERWKGLAPGDEEQAALIEGRKADADRRWRAAAAKRAQELKQGSLTQLRKRFEYRSFAMEMVSYIKRVLDGDHSDTVGLLSEIKAASRGRAIPDAQDATGDDMEVDAELELAPEDVSEVSGQSGEQRGSAESNEEVEESEADAQGRQFFESDLDGNVDRPGSPSGARPPTSAHRDDALSALETRSGFDASLSFNDDDALALLQKVLPDLLAESMQQGNQPALVQAISGTIGGAGKELFDQREDHQEGNKESDLDDRRSDSEDRQGEDEGPDEYSEDQNAGDGAGSDGSDRDDDRDEYEDDDHQDDGSSAEQGETDPSDEESEEEEQVEELPTPVQASGSTRRGRSNRNEHGERTPVPQGKRFKAFFGANPRPGAVVFNQRRPDARELSWDETQGAGPSSAVYRESVETEGSIVPESSAASDTGRTPRRQRIGATPSPSYDASVRALNKGKQPMRPNRVASSQPGPSSIHQIGTEDPVIGDGYDGDGADDLDYQYSQTYEDQQDAQYDNGQYDNGSDAQMSRKSANGDVPSHGRAAQLIEDSSASEADLSRNSGTSRRRAPNRSRASQAHRAFMRGDDEFLVDDDGEPLHDEDDRPLKIDETYGERAPQMVTLLNKTKSNADYRYASGTRGGARWTAQEQLLLYREIQKVPIFAASSYHTAVLARFGIESDHARDPVNLSAWNIIQCKDKLKDICKRRARNQQPIVGNARFYLPRTDPRKVEFDKELQEAKAELDEQAIQPSADQDEEDADEEAVVTPRKRNRSARDAQAAASSAGEGSRASKTPRRHARETTAQTAARALLETPRSSQVRPIMPAYSQQAIRQALIDEKQAKIDEKRRAQEELAERRAADEARKREAAKVAARKAKKKQAQAKAKAASQSRPRTRANGRARSAGSDEDEDEDDQDAAEGRDANDEVDELDQDDDQAEGGDAQQGQEEDDEEASALPDSEVDDAQVVAPAQDDGTPYEPDEDDLDDDGDNGHPPEAQPTSPVTKAAARGRAEAVQPRATRARSKGKGKEVPPAPDPPRRTRSAADSTAPGPPQPAPAKGPRPRPRIIRAQPEPAPANAEASGSRPPRRAAAIHNPGVRSASDDEGDTGFDFDAVPGAKRSAPTSNAVERKTRAAARQQAEEDAEEDRIALALTSEMDAGDQDDPIESAGESGESGESEESEESEATPPPAANTRGRQTRSRQR